VNFSWARALQASESQSMICFTCFKKNSQATESREFLIKFSKKSSHIEEENYEITKIFGGFGKFLAFLFLNCHI
jgi:hypothetical protein